MRLIIKYFYNTLKLNRIRFLIKKEFNIIFKFNKNKLKTLIFTYNKYRDKFNFLKYILISINNLNKDSNLIDNIYKINIRYRKSKSEYNYN